MNKLMQRLGLLALLVSCLQVPRLYAQPPVPNQSPYNLNGATPLVDTPIMEPLPPPTPRPYQRVLNSHGMSCASNFNQVGCGNFWSEFRFVFGSCRTFFGQPCIPNPPHFGPGNGYGFEGPQKCCGN